MDMNIILQQTAFFAAPECRQFGAISGFEMVILLINNDYPGEKNALSTDKFVNYFDRRFQVIFVKMFG